MLFECWNSVKPSEIFKCLLPKSLILLTNERINQKTFGVKPHKLDPGLTIVDYIHKLECHRTLQCTHIWPRYGPAKGPDIFFFTFLLLYIT